MDTPKPTTIADMLAELGAPRNYAEQCLMQRMRDCAARQEADSSVAGRAWSEAFDYAAAIRVYRQHGADPVIPGVYGVPPTETE